VLLRLLCRRGASTGAGALLLLLRCLQ